jgi:hypothetical protein
MDIAALSAGISQMKMAQAVSIKVAKLSMDSAETMATEMVKALEQSVQPHKGGNIDLRL